VNRLLDAVRRHAGLLGVVALAAAAQIEIWVAPVPGDKSVIVPLAVGWTLPLAVGDRFPATAGLTVLAVLTLESFLEYEATENTVFLLVSVIWAAFVLGSQRSRLRAIVSGLLACALVVVSINAGPGGVHGGDVLFAIAIGLFPWLGARVMMRRSLQRAGLESLTVRLLREREEEAWAAVAEERARITSELYDVIAHGVNAMTVQAGAARLLLASAPDRARDAIFAVEETGRQSLEEMRRLLGILRAEVDEDALAPQPGLARLPALIERLHAAGRTVELETEGQPPRLGPGLDLAAYRVVEEALEGGFGPAAVALRYGPETIEIEISTDAGRFRDETLVLAMRERVGLYGGTLVLAGRGDGRALFRVRLPVGVEG
jgi:signal transduction histidine kinase